MRNKFLVFIIVFILFIGIVLRFYQLGNIPNSLDWDEVSWGYNAYSILQTGRDEHGVWYPLSFEGFGDYKQPLYVYLDVLPIKLFGLNEFAVRFPSAFLGSLTVLSVFLLVYELFRKEKHRLSIALLAAFFFAISPWSIQFSRVAFEANTALFFVITGAWIFIKGVHTKKIWYFFVASLIMALSAYTYHSNKIFTPFLFLILLFYGYTYFKTKKLLVIVLCFFFFLCNSLWLIDMRTTARGRSVLFTAQAPKLLEIPIQETIYDNQNNIVGSFVHNRRIVYSLVYIQNYLSHFNPNWLFTTGDNQRHHAPGLGLLYIVSLPAIICGIFFFRNYSFSFQLLLFGWLLLAPVASALAQDAPNASRSLVFLPTWHIFEAIGWLLLFIKLQKNMLLKVFFGCIVVVFMANVFFFVHQYFVHTNTIAQKDWQYGYKEAIYYTNTVNQSKKIIFDNSIEQGYMFYLFHNKISPLEYIKINQIKKTNQNQCYAIKNAYFGSCNDMVKSGDYYVTAKQETGGSFYEKKRIMFANNESAVYIYEYK